MFPKGLAPLSGSRAGQAAGHPLLLLGASCSRGHVSNLWSPYTRTPRAAPAPNATSCDVCVAAMTHRARWKGSPPPPAPLDPGSAPRVCPESGSAGTPATGTAQRFPAPAGRAQLSTAAGLSRPVLLRRQGSPSRPCLCPGVSVPRAHLRRFHGDRVDGTARPLPRGQAGVFSGMFVFV